MPVVLRRFVVAALVTVPLLTGAASAQAAGLVVHDMTSGATAQGMAQSLAGSGVSISNVVYTGAPNAGGTFSGGDGGSLIGFDSGIVMGSGSVQTKSSSTDCSKGVEGPNQCDSNTTANGTPGDPELDAASGKATLDAAVLQFDFVPKANTVQFRYVFSSDEYNEFANSNFNDTFAFFVNGKNCALVPGTSEPVGVNTINGGNPYGTNAQHPQYFRNNDLSDGGGSINTEMDGLTVVLTCSATVTAGQTNHLKLAIADASDDSLDSNVFLEAGSFTSGPPPSSQHETKTTYTGPTSADYHDQVTLSGKLADTSGSSPAPVAGKTITFTLGSQSCTATTNASGSASCSLIVGQQPGNYTVKASFAGDSQYKASSDSKPFTITKEETTLSYNGDTLILNGGDAHVSGVLKEDGSTPIQGRTVTFTLGSGAAAQSCTGVSDASGTARCTITGVKQPLGPGTVTASFAGDAFYLSAKDSASVLVYATARSGAGGSFVVGDKSATPGSDLYFWGAQWWKRNSLSAGSAPAAFKGFANESSRPPRCGERWSARPGNSSDPPSALPSYMAVIVSSSISKEGSTISGNTVRVVIVKTDSGYKPDPGHPGTGREVAELCHS
jgi:hypothetical protein